MIYNRTLIIENNEDLLEFVNDLNVVLLAKHKEDREFCITHKISLIRDMGDCRKVNLESYVHHNVEPMPMEQMELEKFKAKIENERERIKTFWHDLYLIAEEGMREIENE